MAESPKPVEPPLMLPSLDEARTWEGFKIDEVGGASVAKVQSIFCDAESGDPVWVIAKVGRFGKVIAIPFLDCAAGVGRIWVPFGREELKGAPAIDPTKPLSREQELLLCAHYGIHDEMGRAQQVKGRPEGAITSQAGAAAG